MNQAEETLERLRKQAEETDGEQEAILEEGSEEAEEVGAVAEDEEAAPAKKSSTRDYVVLMSTGGGQYKVLGEAVSASSGEAAILSLGEKALQNGSEYVAVPKRNWTTAVPKVETTTVITLE